MKLTKLETELLDAARLGLRVSESCIHDTLDGTRGLESALAELDPVRTAIAKAMKRRARKAPKRRRGKV